MVEAGGAPTLVDLPPAPEHVVPGADPFYVVKGTPATLSWQADGTTFHLQLLSIDASAVLLERDVGPSPQTLEVPWLGTYRWRVAERDARGFESLPSEAGVVCVVEK